MDIKANKKNSANAVVEATITREEIAANEDKLAKQLSKTANIAGFRKGKVPLDAVKKQYGSKLTDDAQAQTIRETLDAALAQMDVKGDDIIGEPSISKLDKDDNGNVTVEIQLSLRPDIALGDYENFVEAFDKPLVTEEDVIERINGIAKSRAPFVDVTEDRPLANGDVANIDFEGFVDDVAFENGKAEGFALELGSKQFIPGFEDQLIGLKKGDETDIKVTFPKDYGQPDLAGKDAVFKIKVNAIQEKGDVVLDDELAKQLLPNEENITIDVLKEQIKLQLENEKIGKLYNEELKPALLEKLVENINFDLPEFVVEQEIDMALNKKAQSMSEEEINELKNNADKILELREELKEDAQKSVKATFIIDALAREKEVNVAEQDVMQTIYYEAMQMGQDPKETYEHYQKSGYLPAVQMAMIEDKVLSQLLNNKMKEA